MASQAPLRDFYETRYTLGADAAQRGAAWRALGARGKVDHLLELADADSTSMVEIGCGDGAVLAELHMRRPGWRLAGVEIAERPVALSRERNPDADVRMYDGRELPWGDDAFDLALMSHVLEHVPEPSELLREAARIAPRVLVEVPLEANVSARRRGKRELSREIGHLQRFARADLRRHAAGAGLTIVAELSDPLPRELHLFFAESRAARLRASAKWALRAAIHRFSKRTAERLFTVHYACVCRRG